MGLFLPPTNEVWGKVICLQVCVCPQGGACSQGPGLGGSLLLGGAWSWGGSGPGRCLLQGGVPGGDTPRMATAAGSMHPTGMHSCCNTFAVTTAAWVSFSLHTPLTEQYCWLCPISEDHALPSETIDMEPV